MEKSQAIFDMVGNPQNIKRPRSSFNRHIQSENTPLLFYLFALKLRVKLLQYFSHVSIDCRAREKG